MPHANTTDVETVLLRTLTDTETDLANFLLPLAGAELRRKIPTLEARMTTDTDFGITVRYVEASAVARIIRNPESFTYEAIGPYTTQRAGVTGGFEFTASELAKLGVGSGAFSVAPYLAPATIPDKPYPGTYFDFGPPYPPTGSV